MAGETGSGITPKKKVKTPTTPPQDPNLTRDPIRGDYGDRRLSNATGYRASGAPRFARGGGGVESGPMITNYAPSKPSYDWWKPLAYKGVGSTEILASAANALIPAYADTEAANIGKWLGENFPDFQDYKNIPQTPSTTSKSALRRKMFSRERSASALQNLSAMEAASGVNPSTAGPGYAYLKKVISLLDKYVGVEGGISRANFDAMQDEFDALSKSEDSSFVELGRAFLNPTIDGTPIMESFRSNGRTSFGQANANLFV